MSEIKACPFCGGNNIYVDGYEHDAGVRWRVVCLDCMGMVDPGTIQQKYRAIEAWNRRAGHWIPVSERLPVRFQVVLACTLGNSVGTCYIRDDDEWNTVATITHWMPLPNPPEGEQL